MSSSADDLSQVIRETRQRLEALARAGVDRIHVRNLGETIRRPSLAQPASPPRGDAPPVVARTSKPAPAPPPLVAPAMGGPATVSSLFGEEGFVGVPLSVDDRVARLAALSEEVSRCERCPMLVASRTRTVFGTGSPTARLMFVGEGPGADEDRTGEPFVGKAGALLTDMITKGMGLARSDVYIANVVKSRPPENRNPLPDEIKNCLPFLQQQIEIIRPDFLCLLGKVAVLALLETALPMGKLRGRWHRYRGIPTIATWHPAYLLRTPTAKRETWEDLQILMNAMGLKAPDKKKPAG